jgi:hypothetical protein
LLYEMSAKHASSDWAGYDRSLEDFEVRSYANIYEQLGLLVRRGLVDLGDVMEALSAQVMADWFTFEPIRTHIMEISGARFAAVATDQPGIDNVYWPNFMWLAARNVEWVQQQATTPGWAALPAGDS